MSLYFQLFDAKPDCAQNSATAAATLAATVAEESVTREATLNAAHAAWFDNIVANPLTDYAQARDSYKRESRGREGLLFMQLQNRRIMGGTSYLVICFEQEKLSQPYEVF